MREQAFQQQQAMERERQAAILARQQAEQDARNRAKLEEEMRVAEAARMAEFQRQEAIRMAGTLEESLTLHSVCVARLTCVRVHTET